MLGAGDAAVAVLARDQPALAVDRVAVRVARRVAEHADLAGRLVVAQYAVVRDIRPHERAVRREIRRPLGPAAAVIEMVEPRGGLHAGLEALVEDLEGHRRNRGKTSDANSSM